MDSIYLNNDLKYPLNNYEHGRINDVWEFINLFRFVSYNLHTYRTKIISSIREKYKPSIFFELEKIAEKLFWNIRYKIKNDDLPLLKEGSKKEMLAEMYENNSYRSFINKLILIADIDDKYYFKVMEGSADIFNKNKFNLLTAKVFFDRNLYESVMGDVIAINSIKDPEYYHQYDYPFPNLNYGKPFIYSDIFRLKRINNMYFDKSILKSESNWFKLIQP